MPVLKQTFCNPRINLNVEKGVTRLVESCLCEQQHLQWEIRRRRLIPCREMQTTITHNYYTALPSERGNETDF